MWLCVTEAMFWWSLHRRHCNGGSASVIFHKHGSPQVQWWAYQVHPPSPDIELLFFFSLSLIIRGISTSALSQRLQGLPSADWEEGEMIMRRMSVMNAIPFPSRHQGGMFSGFSICTILYVKLFAYEKWYSVNQGQYSFGGNLFLLENIESHFRNKLVMLISTGKQVYVITNNFINYKVYPILRDLV